MNKILKKNKVEKLLYSYIYVILESRCIDRRVKETGKALGRKLEKPEAARTWEEGADGGSICKRR